MPSPKISTFREVVPLIYSWRTPDVPKYSGWEKIGYTEQDSADTRIAQQASPAVNREDQGLGSPGRCSPPRPAGASRTADFHAFLKQQGVQREYDPKPPAPHGVAPFAGAPQTR